jgi:nitroimidazol reductase NimA-like FMN-containing flavoprotein (pyridoxamine 5'-phosphate oxidase superfamily)
MTTGGGEGARIRALTQVECGAVLGRNVLGRIAFALHDRVDIQPIHYVYEAGWIYGRTSEGAKLTALARHRWLAFEVDEVRGVFDWASVVVQGSFHRIDPDGPAADEGLSAHAVRLLWTSVPGTLTTDDPVAFRTVVFRISLGAVTGRLTTPPDPRHAAGR